MAQPSSHDSNAALNAPRKDVWRRLLDIDDELAEIDQAKVRGIKELDDAIETIIGRLKRHRKQSERDCHTKARDLFVAKNPPIDTDQKEYRVEDETLSQFNTFLKKKAQRWSNYVVSRFDNTIKRAIIEELPELPIAPSPTKSPTNRAKVHGKPHATPIHLPTAGELILRFWGANKDTSVLPATLLGLGVFTVVTWTDSLFKWFTAVGTLLMVPVLFVLGRTVARKERDKLIREARDAHEAAVLAFAKTESSEALQEHEETLARWVHTRAAAWKETLKKHNDETFFTTTGNRFHDKRRDLILEKKGLEEKDRELQQRKSGDSS